MKRFFLIFLLIFFVLTACKKEPAPDFSEATLHLSYENEADILSDFISSAEVYRCAKTGEILENPLTRRKLELSNGKFGKALHVKDGWSVAKGTTNESGMDLDLVVATMWGDWRTKPHYWGSGKFHGDRGSIAFWVKTSALNPGIVFIQGSIAWGRKERDLLRIDLDKDGKLSASIRDIYYQYHKIESQKPVWKNNDWQHIAIVWDQAYGLKLYHNGELIASNWGKDAWWQTPLPGLFSPFLPESYYDEIYFFDYSLKQNDIKSLYTSNSVPKRDEGKATLTDSATKRLLSSYTDIDKLELPVLNADKDILSLKQTKIADCHDEKIPAWWIMDGRYELAWPHPYLLFTFILGDVDFHSTNVNIDLQEGETANYISLEGVLDGIEAISGEEGAFDKKNKIIDLNNYRYNFYSQKLDMGNNTSLHFPFVKKYGTPPGLIDKGSLKLPLSGKMRLHEVQLWNVTTKQEAMKADIIWELPYQKNLSTLDGKYLDALKKLRGSRDRTLFMSSNTSEITDQAFVELSPLQSFNFFSPDLNPDMAIDKIGLSFSLLTKKKSDVLWIKLRDPANPSRIWAQTAIRINFNQIDEAQNINIELDINDIMLASEDRLWLELMFAGKEKLVTDYTPVVKVVLSKDKGKSLSDYAFNEMIPAKMQYMKEYNYQPWLFNGARISDKGWSNFGGPFDMWYPPHAVLRINPNDEIAGIYKRMTGERGNTYGGTFKPVFNQHEKVTISKNIKPDTPSWAIWEREMYKKQLRTIQWIVSTQRQDGSFWGGYNDDTFVLLGYSGIPLMGDEIVKKSFLKLYDGIEKAGIYKNGYCDIWPIDYVHVTDFITSRGLLFPYAPGDPHVFEREMITARVYKDLMTKNNTERAKKGSPPYDLSSKSARKDPKLWGENTVRDYELTQVHWYWGKTPQPKPYRIKSKNNIAREMMNISNKYDKTEEYKFTKSMRHTDMQGSAPGRQQLITAALGGKLPQRIEILPHSIAVSWDNPDPDIARLVNYADKNSIKLNLYNFKSEPQKISMRLYRIMKGEYQLKIGKDLNDDGEIDTNILRSEKITLSRFSTVSLTIPSEENIAVQLKLIKKLDRAEHLPDLAIHPKRDIKLEGNKVIVTVHNIGDGDAKDIKVAVLDKNENVILETIIPKIKAPIDLVPKMESIEFNLTDKKWHEIVIDRDNNIEEIYEGNNQVINN